MSQEISIVMGHESDLEVMKDAAIVMDQFGVQYEMRIIAVHSDPQALIDYATSIQKDGIKVVIAGSSGAAHLPGMIAAFVTVPVIGVPIKSPNSIDGLDAIYSMLQMPSGVPVATMALDSARNAALFALQILGTSHPSYLELVNAFKRKQREDARQSASKLGHEGWERYLETRRPKD